MKQILIFIMLSSYLFANNIYEKKSNYILRAYYGKSSMSDLKDILSGEKVLYSYQKKDFYGVSFEKYIARKIFDLPINLTYQTAIFYHSQKISNKNAPYTKPNPLVNKDAYQINFGIKAYWTKFPWNNIIDTRFAFEEGVSYVTEYLNVETEDSNKENSNARSKFLNYLELNLEFGMEDLIKTKMFENSYLGVGISHRSGVFGLINGVRGGSNILVFSIAKEF